MSSVQFTAEELWALDLILNAAGNAAAWAGVQTNEALADAGMAAAATIAVAAAEHQR